MFGDPVSPCSSWNIVRSGSDLFFMFIENKRLERLKDPRMFVYLVHETKLQDYTYRFEDWLLMKNKYNF